jgi:YVTN family beta-propeller protein
MPPHDRPRRDPPGPGFRRATSLVLAAACAIACAILGCATGREGAVGGGRDDSPRDSGLAQVWGGALDSTIADPVGGTLLLNTYYDDAILFVDADRGRPYAYARLGYDPGEIALSPNGRDAYVVNTRGDAFDRGSVSIVSLEGRHETARLDPHPYGGLDGVVAARDGVHLYVASRIGSVVLEMNLLSRQVDRTFRVPGTPHLLALDGTETRLFATDENNGVLHSIDLTSGTVTSLPVGAGAEQVVLAPDGFSLWVVCREAGTIVVVDPTTLSVRSTMVSGSAPLRVAFTPDGNRAYAVNSGDGSVSVFDARGLVRLSSIPVVISPVAIAIDGDGRRAWVASERDDRLSVLDLANNLEVSRIPIGQPAVSLVWVAPR